jgi:hypothetical protein
MREPTDGSESDSLHGAQLIRKQVKIILRMMESLDNEMAKLQMMLKEEGGDFSATSKKGTQKKYRRTLAKVFNSDFWLTFI